MSQYLVFVLVMIHNFSFSFVLIIIIIKSCFVLKTQNHFIKLKNRKLQSARMHFCCLNYVCDKRIGCQSLLDDKWHGYNFFFNFVIILIIGDMTHAINKDNLIKCISILSKFIIQVFWQFSVIERCLGTRKKIVCLSEIPLCYITFLNNWPNKLISFLFVWFTDSSPSLFRRWIAYPHYYVTTKTNQPVYLHYYPKNVQK